MKGLSISEVAKGSSVYIATVRYYERCGLIPEPPRTESGYRNFPKKLLSELRRYGLSEIGIGLAILGYGVPGFLFGPTIGKHADRLGRSHLITAGLAITGISSLAFVIDFPVLVAVLLVTMVSHGYDLTQPLFAGIVTNLSSNRGIAQHTWYLE